VVRVPTSSTTAAVITILQIITILLSDHLYVIVISLDFSKAFDTVSHATLLQKFAQLDIPDDVYNWLVDYFTGHSHCTKYLTVPDLSQHCTGLGNRPGVVRRQHFRPKGGDPGKLALQADLF